MKDISTRLIKTILISIIILIMLVTIYVLYYYILPALAGTMRYLTPILLPFILALATAELIDPLVNYLDKRFRIGRGLAVLFVITFLVGSLAASIVWLLTRLIIELLRFSKYLPELSSNITGYLTQVFNYLIDFYFSLGLSTDISNQLLDNITANTEKITNQLTIRIGQFLTGTFHFLSAIPNVLLITIFTVMATFFISRDKEKIMRKFTSLFPQRIGQTIESASKEVGIAFVGFLRAQIVLMLITFFQTLLGLYILGYEYALIIALFVGLVDALPILGPGAVFIPWIGWELLSGNIRIVLALTILYGFITIVRQVLQPKIVSDSVGIHPLEALLGIYGGIKIFGVIGVVVGPIIIVIIKAIGRGWKKHIKE